MKKTALIISMVVVLAVIIYALAGGFKKIEVSTIQTDSTLFLKGKYYAGRYNADSLETLFNQARMSIKAEGIPVIMVYYKPPAEIQEDSMHTFIGIPSSADEADTLIEMNGVGYVDFRRAYFVIPERKKVERKINNAIPENKKVAAIVESYYSDSRIVVALPWLD